MVNCLFDTYTVNPDVKIDDDDDDDNEDDEKNGHFLKTHLNRKQVSSAFWTYLIEEEWREMKEKPPLIGSKRTSQNDFMDKIEIQRQTQLLEHTCSAHCEPRACPKSTSMDGIWKPRCIYSRLIRGEYEYKRLIKCLTD